MSFFRWYMEVGGLLALGYFLVRAVSDWKSAESARWLGLAHWVFVLAVGLPAVAFWLPRTVLPRASVQVWSGRPRGASAQAYTLLAPASQSMPSLKGWAIGTGTLTFVGWLALAAVLSALAWHAWRLSQLLRALRQATEIRRLGRVSVRISDLDPVPYSAWLPGRAYVVLPLSLLARREDFGIALRHEIQHHRQGDTRWVHVFEFFRALFFWNPAAHGWARMTERLQELACDEVLIGRGIVSPQAYGSCLLRAAQQALGGSSALLAGTTGMATGRSGRFLKRRVEMLFIANRQKSSNAFVLFFALGTLALMGGSAFAARGLVQDRSVTIEQIKALVAQEPVGTIPITVNARVLHRLDQYVGTPEGRDYVKKCLARMPLYRAMIESKIAALGFPPELMAMPMQESCFRNDVISPAPYRARGIWQFIQPTGLNYGLQIDDHVDERLDPEKETDAAMRYLKDLKAQFGDWRLALKGYNEGEKHVQAMIDKYHTRDPWALEEISSSEDYLAGTMSMMIILKNPALLD